MECYILSEKDPSFALDVKGASKDKSAQIIIHKFHGKSNQKFRIEGNMIYSVSSGLSLDISGGEKQGANVIQYTTTGAQNQQWFLHPDGTIRSFQGLCLDISGGIMKNSQPVIVWESNGCSNQKWIIVTEMK